MSLSSRNRGSFLIEALLAVVILSTSLSLILQSLISSLRANLYSVDYSQALILLESKMNDSLMKGSAAGGSSQEDNFPEPYERYAYALKTETLTAEDEKNLNQLMLSISWAAGKRKNHISLETYLFQEEEQKEKSVVENR